MLLANNISSICFIVKELPLFVKCEWWVSTRANFTICWLLFSPAFMWNCSFCKWKSVAADTKFNEKFVKNKKKPFSHFLPFYRAFIQVRDPQWSTSPTSDAPSWDPTSLAGKTSLLKTFSFTVSLTKTAKAIFNLTRKQHNPSCSVSNVVSYRICDFVGCNHTLHYCIVTMLNI